MAALLLLYTQTGTEQCVLICGVNMLHSYPQDRFPSTMSGEA